MNARPKRTKAQNDVLTIRLSAWEKAQLEALAKARGLKMSAIARELMQQALALQADWRPLLRSLRGAP